MRIISLCVDGLHQAAQRGLYTWLSQQEADIICLQDLRCLEPETDSKIAHPDGYNAYFFTSRTKHDSSVAIYSRVLPKASIQGMGFSSSIDMEGRYLQIDFDTFSVGSLLAPSTNDVESDDIKQKFFSDFQGYLSKISRKHRNFIFCGNWAMAPEIIDLSNPEEQKNQPGFLPQERQWMKQLSSIGYIDAFRQSNTDKDEYTWWPSGECGIGDARRTDLQIISRNLKNKVEYAMIYKKQLFSSHLPVIVDYDIELEHDSYEY